MNPSTKFAILSFQRQRDILLEYAAYVARKINEQRTPYTFAEWYERAQGEPDTLQRFN